MYTVGEEVRGSPIPANEKKEYFCTFCKADWTAMEVLDNAGPHGFLCHRCNHTLTSEPDRTSTGHEQSTRFNDQFKFISELLPKIDSVHIPECDFDRALSKARPVVRDATHQRAATIPVDGGINRPMAVKGLTNTGPQSIAVNISTSDGPSVAEREAEKARKEKIVQQNALPSWMSNSTVTGESFSGTSGAGIGVANQDDVNKSAVSNAIADTNTSAEIDDYFERLKAEQAAAIARNSTLEDEDEDFDSDSDSDSDEFEDVQATENNSSVGTPAKTVLKQEESGVPSRDESADERALKRVKVEPDEKAANNIVDESSDEEDEEMEFEDI